MGTLLLSGFVMRTTVPVGIVTLGVFASTCETNNPVNKMNVNTLPNATLLMDTTSRLRSSTQSIVTLGLSHQVCCFP